MRPPERYLQLGLRLGRHVDGFVDAYFGPPELARRCQDEPVRPPVELVGEAARLIADLDAGVDAGLSAARRRWLRTQTVGMHTSARKLAGEDIAYRDEVELCYGVRPRKVPEDELSAAHRTLAEALGTGASASGRASLAERYWSYRDDLTVPPERVRDVVLSLAEDLRERTARRFGLPDGEHIDWELVNDRPWSGFNYYLGDLRSRVAINLDLPIPATSIAHLVAHEAYPGHHTEHARKEVGLVRARQHLEETIFCVGTPQCVVAEGLADLGLEIVSDGAPFELAADHLRSAGVAIDPDRASAVSEASEKLGGVRANMALLLHDEGGDVEDAVAYAKQWALHDDARARKAVAFLTDPTWRAYTHCYVDGLELCRSFVGGDHRRFERLITEPLLVEDLREGAVERSTVL